MKQQFIWLELRAEELLFWKRKHNYSEIHDSNLELHITANKQ